MSKTEQIRASINNMDAELVKDALSILLAKEPVQSEKIKNEITAYYKNFAQAVIALKKKYNFPELNLFTVEADLVYVTTGDRRVLLTDRDEAVKNQLPKLSTDVAHSSSEQQENTETDKSDNSMDNAFEPIKNKESRFSHLEI